MGGGAVPAGQAGKGFALGLACLAILFPLWIVIVTSLQTKKTIDEAAWW